MADSRMVPAPFRRVPWLEMIRFGIMGLTSTGIYLVFMEALEWAISRHAWSVALWLRAMVAYLLSMGANYVMQRRVTFRSQRRHRDAVSRFLVVQVIAMLLNAFLLECFVTNWGMKRWLGQTIAVVIVSAWSYGAQKFWVFMKWGRRAIA